MKKKIINPNFKLMPNMGGGGGGLTKSGSDPAASSTAGDLWSDTDNNKIYRRNDGNTAWTQLSFYPIDAQEVDMLASSTIGDYSQPSGATASSEGSTTSDGWYEEGAGKDYTYTEEITGYSSGQNGGHWLNPSYAVDQDTGTAATFDMALDGIGSLKTQGYYVLDFQTADTIANRPINVNWKHLNYSGFYSNTTNLNIEGSTDGISYTNIGNGSVNAYNTSVQNTAATALTYRYIKLKWEGWNNWRVYFYFVAKDATPASTTTVNHTAASAIDDDLSLYWASNAEANPWIYVDHGSATNCNSIALYPNAASTETEIKIQLSASTSFAGEETLARTIDYSNLTNGAWNFIRFNNTANTRYARIYGSSGDSSVLAFNEIKLLNFSDAAVAGEHGHLGISGTDTSLALNGT